MPAGSLSVTTTPVAAFGPRLNALTVTMMVSPTRTPVPGAMTVPTSISAVLSTIVSNEVELFDGLGSVVGLVTVATLTMGDDTPPAGTLNVTATVRLSLAATEPRAQGNPPSQGVEAETKVSPAGVGSSRTTPSAAP